MIKTPDPGKRSSRDVQRMFDNVAPTYDLLNALLSFNIEKSWRRKATRQLEKHHFHRVLDMATGTGSFAEQILRKGPQAKSSVIGVDFSYQMLLHGRNRRWSLLQSGLYHMVQGDAQNLPFCDDSFSAVTIGFGIRNVERIRLALQEAYRVLRPGGRFVILEFSQKQTPWVQPFYRFYFNKLLPMIGNLISPGKGAYTYLPQSVSHFPEAEEFARFLEDMDFVYVWYQKLTFGIVTLFVADVPQDKKPVTNPE